MKSRSAVDARDVQVELTRLALDNSERTVPLQLAAMAVISALGWVHGVGEAALATGSSALVVGAWRLWLARRHGRGVDGAEMDLTAVERGMTANAALTGLMWLLATVTILPTLPRDEAAVFLLLVCGSLVVAAGFLPFVGHAFKVLTFFQLAGLAIVVVDGWSTWSLAMLGVFVLFALSLFRAARSYRLTVAEAICSRLRTVAAMGELQLARDAERSASDAKSRFIATMSHEIRTPMNGVLGAIDLLRHSGLSATQYAWAATAASSGESLLRIVNDVLDHARLESGEFELIEQPTDLRAVASSVVRLFEANARKKGLQLTLEADLEGLPNVHADRQRLKQVLMNLVGNAIKFTSAGSVVLRVAARDRKANVSDFVFEVVDSGIGMSDEVRAALFQPFFQDRAAMKHGGSGLGLAICQRIVRQMGGNIRVDSQPGLGTTVRVELSFVSDDTGAEEDAMDSAFAAHGSSVSAGRLLLVDDNEVNRAIGSQMLRTLGLRVDEACDGEQALRAMRAVSYDLVLMDVEMPVLDGHAATRAQRARESELGLPRTPILAVTANAFDADVRHALAAGMDGHLAKPFTRAQLKEAIARWLRPGI